MKRPRHPHLRFRKSGLLQHWRPHPLKQLKGIPAKPNCLGPTQQSMYKLMKLSIGDYILAIAKPIRRHIDKTNDLSHTC